MPASKPSSVYSTALRSDLLVIQRFGRIWSVMYTFTAWLDELCQANAQDIRGRCHSFGHDVGVCNSMKSMISLERRRCGACKAEASAKSLESD